MKIIGIVVLHFKDLKNTKECIESAMSMKLPSDLKKLVIVVDNASEEPYGESGDKVIVVRNKVNTGFTGGMNKGIDVALSSGCDFIVTINNDTFFDEDFLIKLAPYLNEEGVGIFSPKIYFYPGSEFHYDRYKEDQRGKVIWFAGGKIDWKNFLPSHRGVDEVDKGQYDRERSMDFSTGCCMVFPRHALEEVGKFDEKYFLYYEDVDLSLRMVARGKTLRFVPEAVIWHKNAKSAGGAGSNLQDYYTTRNRMLIALRHGRSRLRFAILREGISLLMTGRAWQKIGVRDFFLGRFGKGSFPI